MLKYSGGLLVGRLSAPVLWSRDLARGWTLSGIRAFCFFCEHKPSLGQFITAEKSVCTCSVETSYSLVANIFKEHVPSPHNSYVLQEEGLVGLELAWGERETVMASGWGGVGTRKGNWTRLGKRIRTGSQGED